MSLARNVADGPEVRISRFQSAGLENALEQFTDPDALRAGQVSVIDLDAVVQRFGPRWPMRRDHAQEHVRSLLDKQLGPTSFHLQISDTDVLICQPDRSRLAGQALCLRALRDILTHFLGNAEEAELGVHEVMRVSPEGVEARRVDVRAVLTELEGGSASGPSPVEAGGGALGSADQWTPFVTASGAAVRVATVLEPVKQLRDGVVMAVRLSSSVYSMKSGRELRPPEMARLTGADLLRIDIAGLLKGLEALSARSRGSAPTVIVPVTLSSLSSPAGRARIVMALKEARSYVSGGVICELRGVDGAPLALLIQAMAIVKPFSLLLVAELEELSLASTRPLRGLNLNGLSTRGPANLQGAAFIGWVTSAVRSAKLVSKSVLLYGLASEQLIRTAQSLGATHASVRAPPAPEP